MNELRQLLDIILTILVWIITLVLGVFALVVTWRELGPWGLLLYPACWIFLAELAYSNRSAVMLEHDAYEEMFNNKRK